MVLELDLVSVLLGGVVELVLCGGLRVWLCCRRGGVFDVDWVLCDAIVRVSLNTLNLRANIRHYYCCFAVHFYTAASMPPPKCFPQV
jgi:hypothetical protein